MKLSVFLQHVMEGALQQGRTLYDALREMKEIGIEGLDLGYDELNDEAVRNTVARSGLGVACMYGFIDFRQPEWHEQLTCLLRRAQEMQVHCIMPLPKLLRQGEDRMALRDCAADGIAKACELAQALDIQVVLEDFDSTRTPFGRLEELSWVLEQIPALGCCFDSGNFYFHGQDALTAYEQLKQRIRHVHLKERCLEPTFGEDVLQTVEGVACYPGPVGSGVMPNREIIRRLMRDGFGGYCAIEHFGARDQLACIRQSAEFIQSTNAGL